MTATSNANTSGLEVVAWRWPSAFCSGAKACSTKKPKALSRDVELEPLVTAASAQARIAELEAERDAWKLRGDQHWETLRSIREFAREGDCERIIQWVNDAGSGHIESVDQTLGQMTDRATAAEARADRLAKVISGFGDLADLIVKNTSHDRVKIDGEWHEGPIATAYIRLIEEVSLTARAALQQETQP